MAALDPLARARTARAGLHEFDAATLWWWSVLLHRRGLRRTARLIKAFNFILFRAVLPPEAPMTAVPRLMHHGFGVVVHPDTVFGRGVHLAHLVTIAASPADSEGRVHPVVFGDEVFVGAGAIIAARTGPMTIGSGAVIGAGSVVLHDVAPGDRVYGNPARPAARRSE